MKTSKYIATALCLSICWVPAQAQFYLDGLNGYNNGGVVAYYENSGVITASGSYTGTAGALTVHGCSILQVDGTYTANGNAVDSFAGDGSTAWPAVAATKTISGTAAPTFDIATFANGTGQVMNITNTQGINIAQRLDFRNGITTTVRNNTATGAVHFAGNATYTNTTLGDAQHVNGYVSKKGNDAFVFPVGSGSDLRTLSISSPATVTEEYSVAWIAGNPSTTGDPSDANATHPTSAVTAPIVSVNTTGQWDWVPVTGNGAGLNITVSIPDLSNTAVVPADLRLVGWNGTSWVNLTGATGNATGNTEGSTLSGTMIGGITAIGIGSVSTVLPVTFTAFAVKQDHCQAAITWATAYEYNNAYFKIERSVDARNFKEIARVATTGNSNLTQQYRHTDLQPSAGWNYYRITQVDADGKSTATSIRGLNFSCNESSDVQVFPTLTKGEVYVDLPAGFENAVLKISNVSGQELRVPATLNGTMYTLQLQTLPAAIYFIKVVNGEQFRTYKVIYQP